MPGLTFSNELISRDEGLHTDFACHLYSYVSTWSCVDVFFELSLQQRLLVSKANTDNCVSYTKYSLRWPLLLLLLTMLNLNSFRDHTAASVAGLSTSFHDVPCLKEYFGFTYML